MKLTDSQEYQTEAKRFLASIAIKTSAEMSIQDKIMIHHGVASLFPKTSPEHIEAKETAYALATAEKKQLKLSQLLES